MVGVMGVRMLSVVALTPVLLASTAATAPKTVQQDSAIADATGAVVPSLESGSGNFAWDPERPTATPIRIHYYRAATFGSESPILIVVPGAGRNGDEYRDAWIDAADEHGLLVLAPEYPEPPYDFAAYHFGGVLENLELRDVTIDEHGSVWIDDEDIVFDVNTNRDTWLFQDFDLLFDQTVVATGSTQDAYDIFGHSAGGQILHRLPLFYPSSKARRIVAGNSGFYTLPRLDVALPFGLGGTPITEADLRLAFGAPLVLLVGELDDASEMGGTHLRTPIADSWGIGRLERGRRFYAESRRVAESMGADFTWQVEVVPGVGHDFRMMSAAAAEYLYGGTAPGSR